MRRHYRQLGTVQQTILKRLSEGPATALELYDVIWPGKPWTKPYHQTAAVFAHISRMRTHGWVRVRKAHGARNSIFNVTSKGAHVLAKGRYLNGGQRQELASEAKPLRAVALVQPATAAAATRPKSVRRTTGEPIVVSVGERTWRFGWTLEPLQADTPASVVALARTVAAEG